MQQHLCVRESVSGRVGIDQAVAIPRYMLVGSIIPSWYKHIDRLANMPSRLFPSSHLLRAHVLSSPPRSSDPSPTKHPLRKAVIIPIISSAVAFSAVAVLFFFIYWYRKLLKRRSNNRTSPEGGSILKICRFKYRQLKRATKCFSQSQKLGKGGFGVVYRGLLQNGKEVAVKRLDLSSCQGEREFQNELSICSKLDSPYVVRLLGYCTHGRRVRLLVYECMQNGSLQEALFEKGYHTHLDWGKRLKIILDIAKALEFLHLHCNPPIIHGDIKPSNILLDSNFSARLADFGLAQFRTEELGLDSASRLRADTSNGFRFVTADHIAPGTPEASRSPTTGDPSLEYPYRTTAESPSVNHKLLTNAIAISSAGEPAEELGVNAAAALPTPSGIPLIGQSVLFQDDAGAGPWEPDCRQDVYSAVVIDVPKDVHPYDSLDYSKSMPLEFCCKQMTPLPLSQHIFSEKVPENDQWQRQEAVEGKEHVMDWLGSELCGSSDKLPADEIVSAVEKVPGAKELKFKSSLSELSPETSRKERTRAKPTHRKSREWWKDEYFAELNSKNKANQNLRRKRTKIRSVDNWKDFLSGELSGELRKVDHRAAKEVVCIRSKEWLHSTRSGDLSWCRGKDRRSMASDMWSGDLNGGACGSELTIHRQWSGDFSRSGELVSRDVSSTTSMRGTVCYVAPENGGNGVPSEKSDMYSFGVLMLVILSGRRPIQVTASPLEEFARANLISWARCLSQSGKLLDLMDEGLRGEFNHKQANICITVALLCLQRVASSRPNISEVVKMLAGENLAPSLPLELCPSHPSRTQYRLHFQSPRIFHHQQ